MPSWLRKMRLDSESPSKRDERISRAIGRSPARSRSDRAARSHSGARCRTASHLAACSRAVPRDALCSAHCRAGAPTSAFSHPARRSAPPAVRARTGGTASTSACSRPARPSAPAAARARTGGTGSPRRIRAQECRATGRGLGLFRGGLRAAFPAARRRLGLSAAGGQVRPGRDCRVAEEDPSAFRRLPGRARV